MNNSKNIIDENRLTEIFKNVILNRFFHFLNEKLLTLLCKFVLRFSYNISKTFSEEPKGLTKQKVIETESVIELIELLIERLMKKDCISYIAVCLCEILYVLSLYNQINSQNKIVLSLENIISKLYQVSSINSLTENRSTILSHAFSIYLFPFYKAQF